MAKDIVNLYAESDRGIISDDTAPALTLENTNTGSALKLVNSLVSGSTQNPTLQAQVAATAAPTIANIRSTNSVASGAHFEFKGFLASLTSASSLQRGIRVKVDGDLYGWIPIYFGGVQI